MSTKTSSPKQTTQSTAPWSGVQPYLTQLYGAAQSEIFNDPQQFYPGQTYANFAPQQVAAMGGIQQRATDGSPLVSGAQDYLGSVLSGAYLGQGNPYTMQMAGRLGDAVQEQVGSRYAAAGRRMGSPGEVQTFQRDMGNALAPYMFQTYGQERGIQQQAAGMAPQLAAQDYTDLQALMGVGQMQQQMDQQGINEDISRYEFGQQEPFSRLSQYGQLLGMGSPYTSTTAKGSSSFQPGVFDYLGLGTQMARAGTGFLPFFMGG